MCFLDSANIRSCYMSEIGKKRIIISFSYLKYLTLLSFYRVRNYKFCHIFKRKNYNEIEIK